MSSTCRFIKAYFFPLLLLLSIVAGGFTGKIMGRSALILKPLGDIFLNLLFTIVVPLVFFSIASAVARLGKSDRLWKILLSMLAAFVFTGVIAAVFMLFIVKVFPPAQGVDIKFGMPQKLVSMNISDQIVNIFTVSDFSQLLSHKNMLPLIFFSLLTGLAASSISNKENVFSAFLQSGADVFMKLISYVMYYAPIGFFAYFSVLVAEFGPQLLENYLRIMVIYYVSAMIYFVVAFSFYAYLAGGIVSIKLFWRNIFMPMVTSLATCSSAASIPANLQATKDMGVPADIYETVIPVGAIMHKDGSVLGAIIKISFLFGIFGMNFSGPGVVLPAIAIALLVGTVMGAIPSGGMLGEMLILSLYGFPPQALIVIAAISIIIDPPATMLNVTGDSVCSMMVAKLLGYRKTTPLSQDANGHD